VVKTKILIVYDTVSSSRVTEAVAQTIRETLQEKGIEVDSFYVKEVDKATLKNYDCLLAGAPTMAFRPSTGITQFFNGITDKFSGKKAAAFDTQIQSRLSGNAAKGIEKRLRNLEFAIVNPPLVAYVEGKGKNQWQLKTGEQEKAKSWAQEVAKTLSE
jgi:flavodoxin